MNQPLDDENRPLSNDEEYPAFEDILDEMEHSADGMPTYLFHPDNTLSDHAKSVFYRAIFNKSNFVDKFGNSFTPVFTKTLFRSILDKIVSKQMTDELDDIKRNAKMKYKDDDENPRTEVFKKDLILLDTIPDESSVGIFLEHDGTIGDGEHRYYIKIKIDNEDIEITYVLKSFGLFGGKNRKSRKSNKKSKKSKKANKKSRKSHRK